MPVKAFIVTARGTQLFLPISDPEVAGHVASESSQMEILLHQINVDRIYDFAFRGKRDQVFLDLGANIGLVSLYASDVCKRIVAVEPAPKTFSIIKKVLGRFPNIEIENLAIAPLNGTCPFFVNEINTTANSSVNTAGVRIEVPCVTLTKLLQDHKLDYVDFCKVDIEGAEGFALNFDELSYAKPIIHTYYIETHNCPHVKWEEKLGRLVMNLSKVGYYKMTIDGTNLLASLP